VTSIAGGTALLMVLHALRLPQPSGQSSLTLPEAVRERFFSYFLAVAGILTWHGVWELWETQLADWPPVISGCVCHFVALFGLLAMRSLRSTLAPPACVALDDDPQYGSLVPTLLVSMKSRGISRLWD
jgi:hypothetical protein